MKRYTRKELAIAAAELAYASKARLDVATKLWTEAELTGTESDIVSAEEHFYFCEDAYFEAKRAAYDELCDKYLTRTYRKFIREGTAIPGTEKVVYGSEVTPG